MSSNTNALTIDGGGTATAVGVGAATITATGDAGQTATLTVQTVPVYQGNWTGTATVLACTDLAGFTAAGYCARNLGTTQPVTLSLNQSGLAISGTMTKAEGANLLTGPVTGATGINGDITLTGTLAGIANGANVQLALDLVELACGRHEDDRHVVRQHHVAADSRHCDAAMVAEDDPVP